MAAVCAFVTLAFSVPAHAQSNPPNPGGSAVNQYVELVPTGVGSKAPGIERKKQRTPLPPAAKDTLKKADPVVAKPLEKIATSSDYGAPAIRAEPKAEPKTSKPRPRPPVRNPDIVPPDAPTEVPLGTTVRAIASATDERLLGLLVVMLMTTLGAVGLALRRAQVA